MADFKIRLVQAARFDQQTRIQKNVHHAQQVLFRLLSDGLQEVKVELAINHGREVKDAPLGGVEVIQAGFNRAAQGCRQRRDICGGHFPITA